MKILMIYDIAGVGFSLSKQLIKKGNEVTLLVKKSKICSYPVWVREYKNKIDEFFLKCIPINNFDILHLHYLNNWSSFGLLFKRIKRPLILHAHGSDTRPANIMEKVVQRAVAKKANILLYSTPDLKKNLNWFKGQLVYSPNPVEIPERLPKPIKYNNRVLIFTTLNKVKKIEKIFPVIKNLDYQFDIIDAGPDKEYYKKIAPRNTNFIESINHEKIKEEILKYPLIVGGSQDGTIRVCELEAMSLGIPTLFPFRYNHFYSEPLPMPNFNSSNITKYFGDYKLGKKQKEWVNKHHNAKTITKKIVGIYKSVIKY